MKNTFQTIQHSNRTKPYHRSLILNKTKQMKPFSISLQLFRETQNAKIQNFITKKPKNQHINTHIMKLCQSTCLI